MKYMTFRASCSYAGIANLLSMRGIDTEDREIALEMRLPYLFSHEGGEYLSGTMLQGRKWFDLYLNPLGLALSERQVRRNEVPAYLSSVFPSMLGLRVSPESKHAVICTGHQKDCWQFINNKRQDSPEPEDLSLTEADLLSRLDPLVTIGTLVPAASVPTDYRPLLTTSLSALQALREEIFDFCGQEQSPSALIKARDSLFRPLLLDGVDMLTLLGERDLASRLKEIQGQFLSVLRRDQSAVLAAELNMFQLDSAVEDYQKLIVTRLEAE